MPPAKHFPTEVPEVPQTNKRGQSNPKQPRYSLNDLRRF